MFDVCLPRGPSRRVTTEWPPGVGGQDGRCAQAPPSPGSRPPTSSAFHMSCLRGDGPSFLRWSGRRPPRRKASALALRGGRSPAFAADLACPRAPRPSTGHRPRASAEHLQAAHSRRRELKRGGGGRPLCGFKQGEKAATPVPALPFRPPWPPAPCAPRPQPLHATTALEVGGLGVLSRDSSLRLPRVQGLAGLRMPEETFRA